MVNTDKHHVAMPRLYDLGDAPLHNLTCTTLKPREAQLRSRARRGNIRVSNQIKYIPFYCISSLLISIRQPKDFSIGPDVAWRTRQAEPKTRGKLQTQLITNNAKVILARWNNQSWPSREWLTDYAVRWLTWKNIWKITKHHSTRRSVNA